MQHPFAARLAVVVAIAALTACQNQPPTTPTGKLLSATGTVPVGKTPHGLGAAAGFVYNANIGEDTLSVIDTRTDTVVKTIPVENGTPGYVKAFPDEKTLMVTDTKQGKLMVFDPNLDHKLLQTIDVGPSPDKIVVDRDDNRTVYVSLVGEPKLVQLTFDRADRSKPPVRKDFAVGPAAGEHRLVAYEGGKALVPNSGDNTVSIVNTETGAVTMKADGNNPGPVAIGVSLGSPKSGIVGNVASNTLTIYDLVSGDKATLSEVGLAPTDAVVDIEQGLAYVTMAGSNDVAVVDYIRGRLAVRVSVGARPVHIYAAPDLPPAAYAVLHGFGSHEMWVGNDGGDSVSIIDGATLKVRATVAVGKGHHKMAFWGDKAYVSNLADNTVSVIDRRLVQ